MRPNPLIATLTVLIFSFYLIVEIRGLVTSGRNAKLQVMLIGNCISWPNFNGAGQKHLAGKTPTVIFAVPKKESKILF